jgi:predicted membrane protein
MIAAACLLGLGVILLLSNLGLWPWGIGESLWRLWPVLLIALGLDLIVGKGRRWLSGLLLVVLILGLAGLTLALQAHPPGLHSESLSLDARGASRARVELSPRVARLHLGAAPAGEPLLQGTVRLGTRERLKRVEKREGELAVVRLEQRRRGWIGHLVSSEEPSWDLRLSPSLPIDLEVATGIGETELDLRELQLRSLWIDTGIGVTEVSLPARGRLRAEIQGGVGEITVRVPASMAAHIQSTLGLGDLEVHGGFERQGDDYRTPGFDGAADRVELIVHGGVGHIEITREPGSAAEAPPPPEPPAPPPEAPAPLPAEREEP